jgi:alpha-amylase/alpha-mannosidase (GH57 family)
MERYLCIHGHFYQPPRENPWLEAIEVQDSAYPYHDWNERITAECYEPNSASRILDNEQRITSIGNTYEKTSFNFGPTLLSWMEENAPRAYSRILQADHESQKHFSGHGNAIAQAYNHMIMPLASRRDRQTQIIWGIRDFERRFQRFPEGMWLPETAVDVESLELLAEQGIRFTILAPHQAGQVRRLRGGSKWRNVEGAKIDPSRAYVLRLRSGRTINLFFYDGPISRAVAFERLLSSGENFAQRLISGFSDARRWPQLMHIATDGETYGHHHPHGDMALAYAINYIESKDLAKITNYGEFLEKHPPTHEVQIINNTSWSCVHGVERWRSDCGCNSGRAGWNQQWRAPLRRAFDWLRDELAGPWEQQASDYLRDPSAARDDYANVILDRSQASHDEFLLRHAVRELAPEEKVKVWNLLEIQRHAMLMYTSCGWFFDEVSGTETVQVIMYAGRAVQLAKETLGLDLREAFLEKLGQVPSNIGEYGNGANIYKTWVESAALDLPRVMAHYAISSLFEHNGEQAAIYCYQVKVNDSQRLQSGKAQLLMGDANLSSRITEEAGRFHYAALHLGEHNVNAGVRVYQSPQEYGEMQTALAEAFNRGDIPESLRLMDRYFEGAACTLKSLFRDEQRRIVREILRTTLTEAEQSYRHIYEGNALFLRFLADMGAPEPKILHITAEFVINSALRRAFEADTVDAELVRGLLDSARRERITLDATALAYRVKRRLAALADALAASPTTSEVLDHFEAAVNLIPDLPFAVDLWQPQNVVFDLLCRKCPSGDGEPIPEQVQARLAALTEKLQIRCAQVTEKSPTTDDVAVAV